MDIKPLLRQFNLRPKKSLGQNFLVDEHALSGIVRAAEITADDVVLEIGPGLGSLTRCLADAARHVIAVEIDRTLIPPLRSVLSARSNVTIVEGDILKFDPTKLLSEASLQRAPSAMKQSHPQSTEIASPPSASLGKLAMTPLENYKVVANIPYYITSAIIRHLLEADIKPRSIVLTIQQEVAQRLIAQPDDMNLLAVSVQFYGVPRIVQRIPAGAFYPVPDVDSAVVRIDLSEQPRVAVRDVDMFFNVAKAGFGQKRKQLHNSLAAGLPIKHEQIMLALNAVGIDPKRRAETLTLEEWGKLSDQLMRLESRL
ncbi:MAG TPA: 16S rRNA (adenine(1518)-N(6)/adenine(1519)-N(6))-dimethyltransferase RsmA [Anaerolineae bacterium]|nr:16S rRNA (adenine(1518)-N(6)/adenine(1519)-N(6))-dimethyltransferase RsmA [Anaerolineae bacterium]